MIQPMEQWNPGCTVTLLVILKPIRSGLLVQSLVAGVYVARRRYLRADSGDSSEGHTDVRLPAGTIHAGKHWLESGSVPHAVAEIPGGLGVCPHVSERVPAP